MKRHALYFVFCLIFVAASCELLDPYEPTAPTYQELTSKVDSLHEQISDIKTSLLLTQEALRIQSQNSLTVDSVILERLKYLYSTR